VRARGPVLVSVITLGVVMIVTFFLILPKMSSVSSARDQLQTEQQHEQELEVQLQQLQDAQQAAPETEQKLSELRAKIPPTLDEPGLIRAVSDAGASASVDVLSLAPGTPSTDPSGNFSLLPVTLQANGSFFSIDEFLFRLERLPRAMKVLTVDISPGSPPFELSVNMSLEVYTTDVSAGPGSVPGPSDVGGGSSTPATPALGG
jgi:Tfp pilus assembly protein PilO